MQCYLPTYIYVAQTMHNNFGVGILNGDVNDNSKTHLRFCRGMTMTRVMHLMIVFSSPCGGERVLLPLPPGHKSHQLCFWSGIYITKPKLHKPEKSDQKTREVDITFPHEHT